MSQNPPDGWASPSSGEQQEAAPPSPQPPRSWGQPNPQVGYPPAGPPAYPPTQPPPYPPTQPPPYPQQYAQQYGPPRPPAYPVPGQPPWQVPYGAPPPKPGVVPLRPLGLNEILDGAVQTIRQNPVVMLGLSAVVNVVLTLVVVLIQIGNLRETFGGLGSLGGSGGSPGSSDQVAVDASQLVASVVAGVLQFVGTTLLTGLLVIAVSDAVLGRRPGVVDVWNRAKGRLLALLGVTLLVVLAVFGIAAVCVLPGILLAVTGGAVVGAVLLILVGALAAVVLGCWVAIRFLFAPPTVLLERSGVLASMRRSWRLVGGSWWRCFGIWLLAQLLASVLSGVLQFPLLILATVLGSGGAQSAVIALTILASVVARTLVAPFSAAILALLYIDLRMRREGLDVRLQQAAAVP